MALGRGRIVQPLAASKLERTAGSPAMVFSSELFLYGFMPIFFSLYYLIADRRKNWLILIASLIFYGIGAGSTVLVLLVSIVVNQFLALRIEPAPPARRTALLAIGVAVNLLG